MLGDAAAPEVATARPTVSERLSPACSLVRRVGVQRVVRKALALLVGAVFEAAVGRA